MRDEAGIHMANTKTTKKSDDDASSSSQNDDRIKLHTENLALKLKIEQLESVLQAKSFDIAHIKMLVGPFSGDDTTRVGTWIKKLEEAFRVLKLNKTQQLIAACDLLTGTAATFRGTICFKDYDSFKVKLLEEFQGYECNNEDIVKQLRKKKLQGNNVLEYVLNMIEMANGYDIAEIDLIDIIIDGFEDKSNVVVMLYGVKTIAELKSLLPRYKKRRLHSPTNPYVR